MKIKRHSPTGHKIKALIYGESGKGKTCFGATAPNVIFASAEAGLLSIRRKDVDYVDIKSKQDLQQLFEFLLKKEHKYETVVIDSISEINDIIKAGLEAKIGRPLQIQDWGEISKSIENILRSFRGLDMHVIFVAQQKTEKDGDKVIKYAPSLNGAAATKIAYFMDIVGHISVNGAGEYLVNTQPSPKYVTKDRTGLVGNNIAADFNIWIEATKNLAIKAEEVVYDSEIEEVEEVEEIEEVEEVEEEKPKIKRKVIKRTIKKEVPVNIPQPPEAIKKEVPKKEAPKTVSKTPALAKARKSTPKQIELLQDLYFEYKDLKGDLATPLTNILKAYKIGGIPCKSFEDLTTFLASNLIVKLQGALK